MVEYGDAFWANNIKKKGVQSIHPLQQYQVNDRLEFNPIKVLEQKKRREDRRKKDRERAGGGSIDTRRTDDGK